MHAPPHTTLVSIAFTLYKVGSRPNDGVFDKTLVISQNGFYMLFPLEMEQKKD